MKCPQCNYNNKEGDLTCIRCGKQLYPSSPKPSNTFAPPPAQEVFCVGCGTKVKPLDRFCPKCGKPQLPTNTSPRNDVPIDPFAQYPSYPQSPVGHSSPIDPFAQYPTHTANGQPVRHNNQYYGYAFGQPAPTQTTPKSPAGFCLVIALISLISITVSLIFAFLQLSEFNEILASAQGSGFSTIRAITQCITLLILNIISYIVFFLSAGFMLYASAKLREELEPQAQLKKIRLLVISTLVFMLVAIVQLILAILLMSKTTTAETLLQTHSFEDAADSIVITITLLILSIATYIKSTAHHLTLRATQKKSEEDKA